jgi:hypothetical protein
MVSSEDLDVEGSETSLPYELLIFIFGTVKNLT